MLHVSTCSQCCGIHTSNPASHRPWSCENVTAFGYSKSGVLRGIWAESTVSVCGTRQYRLSPDHNLAVPFDFPHRHWAHDVVQPDVSVCAIIGVPHINFLSLDAQEYFHHVVGFDHFPLPSLWGVVLRNSRHTLSRSVKRCFAWVCVTPSTGWSVNALGISYSLTVNERLE